LNESPALKLLLEAGLGVEQKNIAFINALTHPLLTTLKEECEHLQLVQTFKPEINQLNTLGLVLGQLQGQYDLVLMLLSKDKKQSLGWMALAFEHLREGGKLLVACENQYGAKSYESALKNLAGHANSTSKSKCRLFSAKKTDVLNAGLQQQWLDDAKPRTLDSHGLWAQAGLFSWKNADIGSALLLKHLPAFKGKGMDLCCGYGLLSVDILKKSSDITQLHMVEADALALACAEKNLADVEGVRFHHLDAAVEALPKHLNFVVCNPPFHTGQSRDVELGQNIVSKACGALTHGGELYLVANRQLPYEKILNEHLREVECLAAGDGFKVIRGKK